MKNTNKKHTYRLLLHYLLIAATLAMVSLPPSASADNGDVPPELRAKLFLTALTYNKNLEKKDDAQLDIGIVYFPDSAQSREEALSFSKTLEGFKDKKISGRSFQTVLLPYEGNGGLKKKVVDQHLEVIYIVQAEESFVSQKHARWCNPDIHSHPAVVFYIEGTTENHS